MARSVINYTVTDEGRDKGKVFVLTEFPASRAESWAMRAILALMDSGVDLPENFELMGMAGAVEVGFKALSGLKWEVVEPLIAEMMCCIQIIPDPRTPNVVRPIMEEASDIEEIMTRIKLRMEVWKLHTGFLQAVGSSISGGKTKKVSQAQQATEV